MNQVTRSARMNEVKLIMRLDEPEILNHEAPQGVLQTFPNKNQKFSEAFKTFRHLLKHKNISKATAKFYEQLNLGKKVAHRN